MARNDPNKHDGCDRVDEREQQTTIESRSRPQRDRRSQSERVREERPVRHSRVTEETINSIEEPGEPFGVEPCRRVALGEAVPERVIGLALGWLPTVSPEDAEVASVDKAESQRADGERHRTERSQRRSAGEPVQYRATHPGPHFSAPSLRRAGSTQGRAHCAKL